MSLPSSWSNTVILPLISRTSRFSLINFRFPWSFEKSVIHYTLFSNCCNFMLFRALFRGLYVSTFFTWSKPRDLFNAHILWRFSRMQVNIVKRSLVFDFESLRHLNLDKDTTRFVTMVCTNLCCSLQRSTPLQGTQTQLRAIVSHESGPSFSLLCVNNHFDSLVLKFKAFSSDEKDSNVNSSPLETEKNIAR